MNIIQEILPKELNELFETDDFEDNGGIMLKGLDYSTEDLKLTFILNRGDEEQGDKANELWEVSISKLKAERVEIRWTEEIAFYRDHFLLWEFTKGWTNLYFNGPTQNPDSLLSDLYQVHKSHFNHWLDLEKYLNVQPDLYTLCKSSFGLFAKGPKIILELYKESLEKHNKKPHFQGNYNAEIQDNEKSLGLLIIGESYFIGQGFEFNRLK